MSLSRLAVVVALVFAAVPFAGCAEPVAVPRADGDEPVGCVIDEHCGPGRICIDAACVADPDVGRCTQNAACDLGLVCRDGDCVTADEGGECASDVDCEVAERCTVGVEGDCLPPRDCVLGEPGAGCREECTGHCVGRDACAGDADCAPTETCDPLSSVCLPLGDCDDDDGCPGDASCIDDTCVDNGDCATDGECPATQSCVDGECVRHGACAVDADCPGDQRCLVELCVRRVPCASDDDCGFDELCDTANAGGTCTVIGGCATVDDCPGSEGVACLDGVCTRAPCGRNAECDDGVFCNGKETCNPREGCAPGPAPRTEALPTCVVEVCDEDENTLVLTPVHDRCADASPCTDDVCDLSLGCVSTPNVFVPDPGPVGDCVRTACVDGALADVPADDELPGDAGEEGDCRRRVCDGGAPRAVADDADVPAQRSNTDCLAQACAAGAVVDEPATEILPQRAGNDCTTQVCADGAAFDAPANDEVPPQGPAGDCKRQACSDGAAVTVADAADLPPSQGCRDGACNGTTPQTAPNDARCADTAVCTTGTCNVDGSCTQTEVDALCAALCGDGRVGLCAVGDPRAATAGELAGCMCLTPATLTCGVDAPVKQVLQAFQLTATAPAAATGSTFTWDLIGVPADADPATQLLVGATSRLAAFTATTPSAAGVRDYRLRVTLMEPDLPAQTCDVIVEATKIPDTLEVSLFMQVGLDVDLHVVGGALSSVFDFRYHVLHNPLFDAADNDCYWQNCPVCTVALPGQACTPPQDANGNNVRIVDFDDPRDGASLLDKQDPQLDIDNQRGCFTGSNGDLQCIPEKITVEQPDAGAYFVWTHLWGAALTVAPGSLSSPSETTVTVQVVCRGQTVTATRTLSSATADGGATAAAVNSPRRYGGNLGYIRVDVPDSGPCTIDTTP
ncbi:MAG: hypothetical protein FJ137_02455 [Deltaproteobacteria bacterium]|nr:hypothetical protein [Deltaproteobacteria bacterium]